MGSVSNFEDVAAIGLAKTCELLDCGEWRVRELIKTHELISYMDGRVRKVTLRSIRARQERLLEAQTPAPTIPPKPNRSRQEAQVKPPPGAAPHSARRRGRPRKRQLATPIDLTA
jgi:hypothetical protein